MCSGIPLEGRKYDLGRQGDEGGEDTVSVNNFQKIGE